MAGYTAYGAMSYKGKLTGRRYVIGTGSNRAELARRVQRENAMWNRKIGKGKYHAKVVAIKRKSPVRKRQSGYNMFNLRGFY